MLKWAQTLHQNTKYRKRTMNTKDVIKKLKDAGIPARKMKVDTDSPLLLDNYPSRKGIEIFVPKTLEKSALQVKTDKRKKQAVLIVDEEDRTWNETVEIHQIIDEKYDIEYFKTKDAGELMDHFGWVDDNFLEKTTWAQDAEYEIISFEKEFKNRLVTIKANVEIFAPKQQMYFLLGFDEKHTFICQLPEKPKSVADAHKILRPKGLSDKAVRVGEFFFDPVDFTRSLWLQSNFDWNCSVDPDDYYGNHRASIISQDGDDNVYCMGLVWDNEDRHDEILLDGWHKVVKNTELENENSGAWD